MTNRAPIAAASFRRKGLAQADPFYGYGYNPAWPSILSVAHDEADGARLFVILDRPCVLAGTTLPIIVPEGGSPLGVIAAEMVLPVKCRVKFNGPVPIHSAWRWAGGTSSLYDPITGHAPNPGGAECADVPGPYTPPPRAMVISVWSDGASTCTITFDRAIELIGVPDDASIYIAGVVPVSASMDAPETLRLTIGGGVGAGSPWQIYAQPDWIATQIEWPQSGVFPEN